MNPPKYTIFINDEASYVTEVMSFSTETVVGMSNETNFSNKIPRVSWIEIIRLSSPKVCVPFVKLAFLGRWKIEVRPHNKFHGNN